MAYQNGTDWAQEALGIVGNKSGKSSRAKKGRRKRNASVPKSISYPKISARNPIKISREEKVGGGIAAYSQRAKLSAAAKKLGQGLLRADLKSLPKGGVLGAAAIAGAAAFALTTALIKKKARTDEELRENAYQLSLAYRRMRLDLEAKQGRKLTPAQQRAAASAFQKELLKLGLSSHDLSKLNQSFFEKGGL